LKELKGLHTPYGTRRLYDVATMFGLTS